MKVFYSNHLETLADMLRDELFYPGAHPLEKRCVVVPDASVKNFLFLRWAKDPRLKVATGMRVVTWSTFLGQFLPSRMELSLKIERELEYVEDDAVRNYLSQGSPRRKASLADHLSDLFLNYHLYGNDGLKEGCWQHQIWSKVWSVSEVESPTALFHLSFLPRRYFPFFPKVFCLSPSEMFWGDFRSPKEQNYFPALQEYFEEQHPFLTCYGKMGREFLRTLEDIPSEEKYEAVSGSSLLKRVQREIMALSVEEKKGDTSIQIHGAASKLHEVEIVFDLVFRLGGRVLVYAPDINTYAPYIHMVFGGRSDYSIIGLELKKESPAAQGLIQLVQIWKKKFCTQEIVALLEMSQFCEKFQFSEDDVALIQAWRPWEGVIERFAAEAVIDMADGECLGRWLSIVRLLNAELKKLEEKRSAEEWMVYFKKLIYQFFSLRPEDDALVRALQAAALPSEPIVFESVERILESVLSQRSEAFQSSSLHGVRFASLGPSLPADTIIMMGMDEASFPRLEKRSSLCEVEDGYMPKLTERDRYLFLELFLSTQDHFVVTYCYLDEEDGKEQMVSTVVEEMRSYLPYVKIEKHQKPEFAKLEKRAAPTILHPPRSDYILDFKHLKKLAQNPVEFFFERSCGIAPEKKVAKNVDYFLSHWEVAWFRQGTSSPNLPEGRFRDVALQQIAEERENYAQALQRLGVEEVFSVEFKIGCDHPIEWKPGEWIYPPFQIGGATVVGKLDEVTKKGILFRGSQRLEDWVRGWPFLLMLSHLPIEPNLLLITDEKAKSSPFSDPEEAFLRYVAYYEKALQTPSPLLPKFVRKILREGKVPEHATMTWSEDWIPFLRETFHETV